jgi:hypothetical protein
MVAYLHVEREGDSPTSLRRGEGHACVGLHDRWRLGTLRMEVVVVEERIMNPTSIVDANDVALKLRPHPHQSCSILPLLSTIIEIIYS